MKDKCVTLGHSWQVTFVPGWFQCNQIVELKTAARGQLKPVYCGVVACCPGCLGYRVEGYAVVFCVVHQGCRVEDFPVHVSSVVSSSSSSDVEQHSLFE